ncbi:6757_t:CDS:2, partial [Dentiscutata erythropus]
MFNFLPSLTSNDRMLYAYIALEYTAQDSTFYASLDANFTSKNNVYIQQKAKISNKNEVVLYREPNENIDVDISENDNT